jgi:WD40 repeat protein
MIGAELMPVLAGPNPFVGPRPFKSGERLYGREREIGELHFRLNAERIVLLHSPSGAGKSSLVQAGLVPLVGRSFDVWGPTRVNAEPAVSAIDPAPNRYVLSAVQGFEEGVPEKLRRPVEVLAGQTLAGYFEQRPRRRSASPNVLLIFDQFEEILTVDPLAVTAKHDFFVQLGELLRNPRVWALLALREDYLAPLDPYAPRVPTHLKNRFRIDLLDEKSALEALVEPAREGGRAFPAADELVADLATMKVQQPDGTFVEKPGLYVEPVQLQVVCFRLWDAMPEDDLSIDAKDLKDFGDVTEALGAYYAYSAGKIAAGDPARERAIRDWFGECLITAGGIRGQVLREAGASGGLANDLIDELRATHLVRAEQRAGATWYELAHDRLIEPVTSDNAAWRQQHLADVQRRATLWERQGRPPGLLLAGAELAEGERWATENGTRITGVESRFLAESRQAHETAEQERRQARRIRRLAVAATVVGVLAVLACVLAVWQWRQAESQKVIAQQESGKARRAASQAQIEQAQNLIAAGRKREALGYLAQAVRLNPESAATRGRVFSLLFAVDELIPNGPLFHNPTFSPPSFSTDGQRVLTLPEAGAAQVWDAATGSPLGGPLRHEGIVMALSFIRGDRQVVTVSSRDEAGASVHFWDVSTSRELVKPVQLKGKISYASFSSDGQRIVTVSDDETAQVWDTATGKSLATMPHKGWGVIAFSANGQKMATASDDTTWQVRNAATGEALGEPLRHESNTMLASFSADGRWMVTASGDQTAQVWNAETGEKLRTLRRHEGIINSASFSPGGEWVVTSSGKMAQVWDAKTGEELQKLHPALPEEAEMGVTSASFSPDGQWVVTTSNDTLQIWDATTGNRLGGPLRFGQGVGLALFSPDGQRVMAVGEQTDSYGLSSTAVRVWDVAMAEPLGEHSGSRALSFSPDGRYVVTVSQDDTVVATDELWEEQDHTVQVWEVATGEPWGEPMRPGYRIDSASFSPDGRRVVTVAANFKVQVWDVATGELWDQPVHPGYSASFSPDGQRVVTSSSANPVQMWDAATGKPLIDGDRFIAISPDGRRGLTVSTDETDLSEETKNEKLFRGNMAQIREMATGKSLGELRHEYRIDAASFSSDSRRVVTSSGGTAQIWDAATGKPLGTPPAKPSGKSLRHSQPLSAAEGLNELFRQVEDIERQCFHSVSFSPDGQRVLTAKSQDGTARLWDAATGKSLGEPMRHDFSCNDASFSPDGQRVVTRCRDNARLWDASSGKPLVALPVDPFIIPGSFVTSVSFSRDSQRLVTTTSEEGTWLWDVPTASAAEAGLLAEAAEVVGGYAVTDLGTLEPIPTAERFKRLAALRRLGDQAPDHQPTVASFLRWYFTPRPKRTISPLSKMTVEEYTRALLAEEARVRSRYSQR